MSHKLNEVAMHLDSFSTYSAAVVRVSTTTFEVCPVFTDIHQPQMKGEAKCSYPAVCTQNTKA